MADNPDAALGPVGLLDRWVSDESARVARASTAALVVAWFVIAIVRLEPSLESDPGLFLTMFEGVADGERLYVDRWDHKDPVFFWIGALVFFVLGAHGPAILDAVLLLVIGAAAQRLALDRGCPPIPAALIAVGAMGFTTNPAFHATGLTEPPAIALLLGAYVFVGRGQVIAAFVLVSLIAPAKLGFILLAVPVVIAGVRSKRVSIIKQALALGAPALVIVLALAIRGELGGWIDSIFFNRRYAREGPPWFGASSEGIPGHLERLVTVITESPSLLVTTVLLVVSAAAIRRSRPLAGNPSPGAVSTALWFVITMVLTFLTAHLLRAAVPLLVLVGISLHLSLTRRFSAVATVVAVGVLMGIASGPHPSDLEAIPTVGERWGTIDTGSADAVQAVIDKHAPEGDVALAVSIGSPQDAFLPFLDDRVKLVCPTHHLLPWFESRFADHEACMAADADIVVVGHLDFATSSPMVGHRDRMDKILRADFRQLAIIERQDASSLVLWMRVF